MKDARVTKSVAALVSVLAAIVAERCAEQLWIVRMPSGGREMYHSPLSYLSLTIVFVVVAIIVYRLALRVLRRGSTKL
jgi:hypothetical protein